MAQSQESSKDLWTSSQQSGLPAEPTMAKGTAGNPQQIPLQLKWVKSYFSAEEKDFFVAAAMEGKISQTHYANPEADICYRCPICAKVINPSPLSKHTARHFLRMRNTPNCEYVVTLQEDPKKQIRIRTGGNMARRGGADPPPLSQIQDLEEQEGMQFGTGQGVRKTDIPTTKQKPKAKPIKKKKRLNRRQMEIKAKGTESLKRTMKRQKHGTKGRKKSDQGGQPSLTNWRIRKKVEITKKVNVEENRQRDNGAKMKAQLTAQQSEAREPHMLQTMGSEIVGRLQKDETHKTAIATEPLQGNREAIPARASDIRPDRQTQTQRAHPEKRQRSIFEFAGARSQGCNAEATTNPEANQAQADHTDKPDHKRQKSSAELQELPQQGKADEAHQMDNWESINKSPPRKQ